MAQPHLQVTLHGPPIALAHAVDLLGHVLDIDGSPVLGPQRRGLGLRPGVEIGVIGAHGSGSLHGFLALLPEKALQGALLHAPVTPGAEAGELAAFQPLA